MKEARKKARVTERFPEDIPGKVLLGYEHTLWPCQVFAGSPLENPQPGVMN